MARDECAFYYWDAGYSCALKREKEGNSSIDYDTVKKYCWGYHYEECPRYIAHKGGGCFITSACVEAKGLSDNCRELTVLRNFRDNYMKSTKDGCEDLCNYYHVAPIIVANIKRLSNAKCVYEQIYNELILPCVDLIENDKLEEAYQNYKNYVKKLQSEYC